MRPQVFPASSLYSPDPPALEGFGRRFLAEGDSWFTLGTLNVVKSSNVLYKLSFAKSVGIVNCAYPGDTLRHMAEALADPYLGRLLVQPNHARFWEAILVSGGGNDLIDAAQVGPEHPAGKRLLLTPAEAATQGPLDQPDSWISAEGWALFAGYVAQCATQLVSWRDQGPSAGRPIFMHTYALPTVRASGTVGAPQGWLYPAMLAAQLPAALWQPVADRLFTRLRNLIKALAHDSGGPLAQPRLYVFDSAALPGIVPAQAGAAGSSGDWVNEIHLTPGGYDKLGTPFGAYIDQVLASL